MKYIRERNGKYQIRRWRDGKLITYGTFPSLELARKYRSFLEDNDFKPFLFRNPLKHIHFTGHTWEVNCNTTKRSNYLGRFNNLQDAILERDLFIKAGYDWDNYVDGTDDSENGEHFLDGKMSGKNFYEKRTRDDSFMYWRSK